VKSCPNTGKRCYGSKEAARRGIKKLSKSMRVYRCTFCKYWHLTKQAYANETRFVRRQRRAYEQPKPKRRRKRR
jgi:hypothetical protein